MKRLWTVLLLAALGGTGCDKKEDDKYAKGRIRFTNAGATLAGEAPDSYGVRIKFIHMTAPGNEAGSQGAGLWASAQCSTFVQNDDGSHYGDVLDDAACAAKNPPYFDLNRSTAEVNAELNSQDVKILPGTYEKLALGMLGEQQGGNNTYNNTTWSYDTVAAREFAAIITEWSAAIDPPLVVGEEDNVTITLNYSLAGSVTTGLTDAEIKVAGGGTTQPGKYDDCNDERTICINAPSLTVSVSK